MPPRLLETLRARPAIPRLGQAGMGRLAMLLVCLAAAPAAAVGDRPGDWYVGEQVVCVNNRFLDLADAPELSEGSVYTVTAVLPRRRGYVGLAVLETPARDKFLAFDERRFRPLKIVADAPSGRPRSFTMQ